MVGDDRVKISILDNELGMNEQTCVKLFEPFLQQSQLGRERDWNFQAAIRLLPRNIEDNYLAALSQMEQSSLWKFPTWQEEQWSYLIG